MQRTGGPSVWGDRDYQGSHCPPPSAPYGHPPSPSTPPWKYSPQLPPPPLPPPPPYPPHSSRPGPPPRDCPPPHFQDRYEIDSKLPPWQRDDNFLPPHHPGDFHRQHPPRHSFADDDFDPPPPPPPPPYPPRGHPGMRARGESQSKRGSFSGNSGSFRGRGGNKNVETSGDRGKSPARGAPYTRGASMSRGRGASTPRGSANFRGSASGRGSHSVRGSPSVFRGATTARGRGGKTQSNGTVVGQEANKTNKSPFAHKNKEKQKGGTIKAAVPGSSNFISFKNSLQECCQKKQLSVPSYTTFKNGYGFSAKVSVAGNTFASSGIQATGKDAEQSAAHAALISLQLVDASVKFDAKAATAVKRPAAIDNSIEHDGKRIKIESKANTGYKSQLNEFCQKFHLSIPVYECKPDKRKGFSCTVLFNSKTYESHSPQPTKKQAEQNAAQVVLSMLNQCPPPAPNFQDYIEQCRQLSSQNTEADSTTTTSVTVASTSTTASPAVTMLSAPIPAPAAPTVASYKNKLQEYCQKSKLAMPVYNSTRQDGVFSCTVEVAGKTFTSTGCNTKKGCEQTAANVALKGLGLV